jgi:hypothetical protein
MSGFIIVIVIILLMLLSGLAINSVSDRVKSRASKPQLALWEWIIEPILWVVACAADVIIGLSLIFTGMFESSFSQIVEGLAWWIGVISGLIGIYEFVKKKFSSLE